MQKLLTLLLAFCLIGAAATFTSCGDEGEEQTPATMSATIDGNDIDAFTFSPETIGATYTNNIISVTGTTTDGKVLNMSITTDAAGTYTLNNDEFAATYTEDEFNIFTFPFPGTTNTVTISTFDTTNKEVSGSFSFSLQVPLSGKQRDLSGTFSNVKYE